MGFIDRKTSREAQAVRKNRGKFDTPDRDGTYLAFSQTGKHPGEGHRVGALGQALKDAGIEPTPRRTDKATKGRRRAERVSAPVSAAHRSSVQAIHQMAKSAAGRR